MISFRTMRPEDIAAGLSLCRLAGWNQLERDWKLFLQLNPRGCQVAVDEKENVIGTVATLPYQNNFTWIGMVLVDPARRREGIGTQLLNQAINLAGHHETLKLDATPAGREVYLKLNFLDEYNLTRMKLDTSRSFVQFTSSARPARTTDFAAIQKLDNKIFGAERRALLESNFSGAPQYACVMESQGELLGYCFGRPGFDFDHIGPVVAPDATIAIELLLLALQRYDGKPVIIDVPDHSVKWIDFLSSVGFVASRLLIRMHRGPNLHPGLPEKQFAILGPEFG